MGARPSARLLSGLARNRAALRDCSVSIGHECCGTFLWRSPGATLHSSVRAARVRGLTAGRHAFQDRTGGHDAARGIPPQRDHEFARDGDNPKTAGAFAAVREPVPIPTRQRAQRLPAHPIPRELNADRLQARIPGTTDPLLVPQPPATRSTCGPAESLAPPRPNLHSPRCAATARRRTPTSSPASTASRSTRMPHTTSARVHYATQGGSVQSSQPPSVFDTPRSVLAIGPLS